MYGLKAKHIEAINSVFVKHPEIHKAVLYGSRAKGNYRNGSDIDLTLKGEQITLTQLFEIETELDDLLLPYKIDLSIYHKIENPEFMEHIKRVGIVFYENETNKWKETTLDNHIDLISGYAFKSKDFIENQEEGTLPIIKIKNVANGDVNLKDVVYHNYEESLSKYTLSKGDVLIAMTGNHPQAKTQVVGDVSRYKLDVNALLNQRVGKIVPKGKTNLDFLYYFFKDKDTHRYLANQSSGSANQANISKANIIGMETEFPEPNEQKAIAKILKSIDDKIDLLHTQNETLEAMSETLFRQWFVEEADEDWEIKKFEDILKISSSKRIFYKEYVDVGIPFYRSKEIIELSNGGTVSTELFITEKRFNEINEKFGSPKTGDILLTSVGTLGISYQVKKNEKFYFKDGNLTWFSNFKDLPSSIIFCWLNSSIGKEYLDSISIGSTQAALTISSLRQIEITIPPIEIINSLDSELKLIQNKINSNQNQIRSLEKLRDSLLPKLMSGELKVIADE